jgi:hypothetical protein
MAGLEDEIGRTILDVISADPVNRIRDALMPALQAYKRSGESALRGPPPGPSFEPNAAGKIPPVDSLSDLPMSAAADVAGMLLPTMGSAGATKLGMFFGPRAFMHGTFSNLESNAMLNSLEKAKSMTAKGAPWWDVYSRTMWDKPPGSGWVTPINNEGASINPDIIDRVQNLGPGRALDVKAPEVFRHKVFYQGLPEAQSMKVHITQEPYYTGGRRWSGAFVPELSPGDRDLYLFGTKDAKETLAHELAHAEQKFSGERGPGFLAMKEGLNKFFQGEGISPKTLSTTNLKDEVDQLYSRTGHEAMARESANRIDWPFEKSREIPLSIIGGVPREEVIGLKPTTAEYRSLTDMEDLLAEMRRRDETQRQIAKAALARRF